MGKWFFVSEMNASISYSVLAAVDFRAASANMYLVILPVAIPTTNLEVADTANRFRFRFQNPALQAEALRHPLPACQISRRSRSRVMRRGSKSIEERIRHRLLKKHETDAHHLTTITLVPKGLQS